jgi:hypothetical protein
MAKAYIRKVNVKPAATLAVAACWSKNSVWTFPAVSARLQPNVVCNAAS